MQARMRTETPSHRSLQRILVGILSVLAWEPALLAAADGMVPFVIPAKADPASVIAATPQQPIRPDSPRLIARNAHFYRANQRVRLWGVNLSFSANFPTREDAPHVAARLAAVGVNSVRCHHMDTSLWPRGLYRAGDGKVLEPEALDRLDFFIHELAKRGICVNINLHVGRAHSRFLGLPETNRQYDKMSGIFTPALIEAQKGFARDLLTRVNPYRRVRYADDPAVAFVEITNEDSFFMWSAEDTLQNLPPYYNDILQSQYNAWLKGKYNTSQAMGKTWSEGVETLGENRLTNGDFASMDEQRQTPDQWTVEQHSGCRASVARRSHNGKRGLRFQIDRINETTWHLQFNQSGLAVEAGKYYTVTFEAAAEGSRPISCSVGQAHEPWGNLGLSRQVKLEDHWRQFRLGFVAEDDDGNARISFSFGADETPFYLANVALAPGGRVGLAEGESIPAGTVKLYGENESPARVLDRMMFLAETEKTYFDEMRRTIKKDLNCDALVTGTIVFGPLGLYAQSDMDFIDAHAYWQHPRFPGRPWDQGNWLVDQKPMTDFPEQATLFRIASERLAGKPFTLSEYNHPAPLDSQAECVPMVASFAAAQDWDAVWLYTYSHTTDDWHREALNGYFDIDTNPAKWGFMRAGAAIFVDGAIRPLLGYMQQRLAPAGHVLEGLARLHRKHDRDMVAVLGPDPEQTRQTMLRTRLTATLAAAAPPRPAAGQGTQLDWTADDNRGFYKVIGNGAGVYTGHADAYAVATAGRISIQGPEFVALTVTALDEMSLETSKRILVTACGRCENTGMKFSEDRRTVGRDWGEAPVRIEPVDGVIILPRGQWQCQALNAAGLPVTEVTLSRRGAGQALELSSTYKTMWYLLTQTGR